MQLSDEQRLDWLRLIRSESVGPRTFRALVNRFGGARPALEALPDLARQRGRPGLKVATREAAERELREAGRLGARFIALGEPDYPRALQAIDTAPPLLLVRGSGRRLGGPAVAIVGSRNASAAGLAFTERLSRGLGEGGLVVVSGLARGLAPRPRRGALGTGPAAVRAGGHDRVYPPENAGLLQAILEADGAVVSEMPMGWEPRGRDFPRRNRIVSGLAHGVVVVEAARRSGSLITARFALEQGREVFAVPGSPLDPRAEGTNDLIRQGATLCAAPEHVTSVLDPIIAGGPAPADSRGLQRARFEEETAFWDELEIGEGVRSPGAGAAPVLPAEPEPDVADEGDERARLVRLLGPAPIGADELVRQSRLSIRAVQAILLELELAGRLERHGGNAVSLIASGKP